MFRKSVWVSGSIGLMTTPSVPFVTRVLNNFLLRRRRAIFEKSEIQIHVTELPRGEVATQPHHRPVIVRRAADKNQVQFFLRVQSLVFAALKQAHHTQGQNKEMQFFHN